MHFKPPISERKCPFQPQRNGLAVWTLFQAANVAWTGEEKAMLGLGHCCIWVRICLEHNFPGGSVHKNPPAMLETRVWSLGLEDPLEKGMAAHSSILAWRIPWTEEPGGLQSMGLQKSDTTWQLNHHHYNFRQDMTLTVMWFNYLP